jgi:dihydroorotase-like cyclic amidohydrolase
MTIGDQDGEIFFRDGEIAVLDDGNEVKGHFRIPENVEQFGQLHAVPGVIEAKATFSYWTATAPDGFGRGTKLAINGVQYEIRTTELKSDGRTSMANLKKVPVS